MDFGRFTLRIFYTILRVFLSRGLQFSILINDVLSILVSLSSLYSISKDEVWVCPRPLSSQACLSGRETEMSIKTVFPNLCACLTAVVTGDICSV